MSERPPALFDLATIGAGLPFAQAVPELIDAVTGRRLAVVQAPPGTGKTTLVPPAVADLVSGRVVVTAPRRVAVRAAARRLAGLDGSELGGRVGFTVRQQSRTCARTVVEFVTPGVLLRRLLSEPDLPGVGAVVLDEVHERALDTDLLVGMLAEVAQLRDDLVVVAMSATLDAPRFAAALGGQQPAPVIDCPAALHPLQVRWAPPAGLRLDAAGMTRDFLDHVADQCVHAVQARSDDALVFLPGVREIAHVSARLRARLPRREVLELHGRLSPRQQDHVVSGRAGTGRPRVVVATAVAESSITVPGVRVVLDAGLSREPRRDLARDMSGLVTVSCSRDAAVQRAGRAARLGPGLVVRCYDEATFARMPAHVTAQIGTTDLTSAALTLACWGAPGGAGLALPDPPPVAALQEAQTTLRRIGAIDHAGKVTAAGRSWARLPLDPRLARALQVGATAVSPRVAAQVVAAVSDDGPVPGADLGALLTQLRAGRAPAAGEWATQVDRLVRLLQGGAAATGPGVPPRPWPRSQDDGYVIALAFPERIARRAGATYLFASGTRAALPPDSPLQGHDWLAVADVGRASGRVAAGSGAVIRAAAPIGQDVAEVAAAELITDEVHAGWRDGRVTARQVRAIGAIELVSTPVAPSAQVARDAVAAAFARTGPDLLTWSSGAQSLRRRLAFLHHHLGPPWPDVGDDALSAQASQWLAPELDALAAGGRADRIDVLPALRRLLPWPEATRLEELAPERLAVPSGSQVRIDYPPTDRPQEPAVVAVKLQECFGLTRTPRLAGSRAPVVFHLLSPARRPLAVTDDLASFWSGPYAQVRAEMRGRYPRHPWPQDPWSAPATARTTRRGPTR